MSLYRYPNCHKVLNKVENTYKCENNHSLDISSKGYVNMLLANQRHSINPGDSKEMILSRVKFLECDYYHFLRETILNTIKKYAKKEEFNFADLACGEGYYTNYIHQELNKTFKVNTIGVDISKFAIIEGCKKKRALKLENIDYCIGNLMNLPFLDNSFHFMLNCFALLDEKEFNRVLENEGYFIRVLPDADHLLGIKEVLYENVIYNVMKEKDLNGFKLIDEIHIKDDITLKNKDEIVPYKYRDKSNKKFGLLFEPFLFADTFGITIHRDSLSKEELLP